MTYPPQQHGPHQPQPPVHGHVAWQHPPVAGGGGFPQQIAASTATPGMGRGLTISLAIIIAAVFAIATMLLLQQGDPSSSTKGSSPVGERADAAVIEQGSATGRLLSISDTGITILGHGGEGQSFAIDASIPRASLQALNASKADVLVKYDRTSGGMIATAVSAAPDPVTKGAKLEGVVTFINESRLSVRQANGSIANFTIAAKDRPKLDAPHLREHQQSGSPVRVFYDRTGNTFAARGYEDAS